MPVVTESVVISRPREEVWRFCEDVRNTPRWNPMFVHQEVVGGGEVALGATVRSTARLLGRTIVADAVITGFDPLYRSEVRSETPVATTGSYTFDEVPGGTRFTWQVVAEPGLGRAFGWLADGLVLRAARWQVRRGLRRLKALLEQQPVAGRESQTA